MAMPELAFEESGVDNSQTVVFLHGCCGLEWKGIADKLADMYHVLIPDAPGHGRSKNIAAPWSLQGSVDAHADLVRQRAHGGKAHLVGFSMGGFTSLKLAQQNPGLVMSLFLSGVYDHRTAWGFKLHLSFIESFISSSLPRSAYIGMARRMGMTHMSDELFDAVVVARGNKSHDIRNMRLPPASHGREWALNCRTLVAVGEKHDDTATSRALAEELQQGHAESQMTIITGAVHWWALQYPETLTSTIRTWLSGSSLPDRINAAS